MSFKPLSDIYNAYNTAYQGQVQKRQAGEDRAYQLQQRDYQNKMQEYNMQDVARNAELNQMKYEAEKNLDKPWTNTPHLQAAKEYLLSGIDPNDTESLDMINRIFSPNNTGRVVGKSLEMVIPAIQNKQQRFKQQELVSVPLFNAGTGKYEIARVPAKEVDNYKTMSDTEEKNYQAEQAKIGVGYDVTKDEYTTQVYNSPADAKAAGLNIQGNKPVSIKYFENGQYTVKKVPAKDAEEMLNQSESNLLNYGLIPRVREYTDPITLTKKTTPPMNDEQWQDFKATNRIVIDDMSRSMYGTGGSGAKGTGGNASNIVVGEDGIPTMVATDQPKQFMPTPTPNIISAGGQNFNVNVPLTEGQTFNVEPIAPETPVQSYGNLPQSILPAPVQTQPQVQSQPQPIVQQKEQTQPYTQEEVMGTPQTSGAITLWKGFPIEKAKDMGINLNDNITRPGGIVPLAPGYMGEKPLMDRFIGKYFAPQYYGSPKTFVAVPVANAEGIPYRAEVVEFGSQDYKDLIKQFEYERAIKLSNGKWTSKKSMEEHAKKDLENAKTQAERDRLLIKIANDNRNFDKALAETIRSNKADESIDRSRITKPVVPKLTKPITDSDNAFALYQANFDALTKLPSLSNTTDPNKRAETTKIAILSAMEEGATLSAILEKIAKKRGLTNVSGKVLSNSELDEMYNKSDTPPVVKYRIDEYRLAQRAGDIAAKEKVKGTTAESLLKPYATLTPKGR